MTSLRVITVGAGYFAAFHHEAWQRHPETTLTAVVDTDFDRARGVGVAAFATLSEALSAGSVDIIDIAVPPVAHAALVRQALAVKPRAIICQKPFGTSLDEARTLAAEARAAGTPLIIHENIRFQPWYRKAQALIEDGTLGDIHQITFRFRTGDGRGPEAYLDRQPYFQTMPRLLIHETAVHWIDTFRYLLGPIEGVYADLRKMNPVIAGEDAGHVVFTFGDGKRAFFDGNRLLDHKTDNPRLTFGEALIEGTAASLALTGDGSLSLRRFGEQDPTMALAPATYTGFAGDCVYALQNHVVAALHGRAEFENEASDYLAVREAEEAIYRSAEEKRWVAL
ncbi:MAG: Gfo/Idh/MocA family oxidoreductase [Pseudomonadota bacterium]